MLVFPGAYVRDMLCRHILVPPRLVDDVLYVVLLLHVDDGVAGARGSHNECSKERYQKHNVKEDAVHETEELQICCERRLARLVGLASHNGLT